MGLFSSLEIHAEKAVNQEVSELIPNTLSESNLEEVVLVTIYFQSVDTIKP